MSFISAASLKEKALLAILRQLEFGMLALTLPSGQTYHITGKNPGPAADLKVTTERAVSQIMSDGKMGFCEAYMAGEISSQSLASLIQLAVLHDSQIEDKMALNTAQRLWRRLQHWRRRNNKAGSRANISYHYDLGNHFYERWLDSTMTYSSAIFDHENDSLDHAQKRKYERLADLADIQPGDRVLEIGCGWGGFAEYAATERGAFVDGITISREQYEFAKARLANSGLSERAHIRILDYRDLRDNYDKIVSIEMFEAVGESYWPSYFRTLSSCLKRGGKAALQVITIADHAFGEYKSQPDFIQKYIFPGGMLPSMQALASPLDGAGLKLDRHDGFGLDYARTLAKWRERFHASWPELARNGKFDERFKRMWELYLCYCEGGFRAGMIDVKQMLITHK